MMKIHKTKMALTPTLSATLFGAAILAVWQLGEAAAQRVGDLAIKRLSVPTQAGRAVDPRDLFPVQVSGPRVSGPSPSALQDKESVGTVERLFGARPVEVKPPEPETPNYPALLASRMQLDGIAASGAFLNGQYYRVGDRIDDFAYPWQGREIVPRLERVAPDHVVIAHGTHRTRLR